MPLTPALVAAINAAYRAFAHVPAPIKLDASPLRDAKAIHRILTAAPLRALSSEQIGPYSSWAITTVGNVQDYRHFLPRILELSVTDSNWHGATPPMIASRLVMGDWRQWPDREQLEIEAVFRAAFDWSLDVSLDDYADPADWLCGLASLGLPVDACLARWRSNESFSASVRLAELVTQWADHSDEKPPPYFWEDEPFQAVYRWVYRPETADRLTKALSESEEDWRCEIEMALEAIDRRC